MRINHAIGHKGRLHDKKALRELLWEQAFDSHDSAGGGIALVPLEAALERNCAIEDRLESPQCRGF